MAGALQASDVDDDVGDGGHREGHRQPTVGLPNPVVPPLMPPEKRADGAGAQCGLRCAWTIFQAFPDGSRKLASTPP